ncbi:MAG: hypothetical protein WA610_10185, partial [Thermodesulfovibrionales bacterium]
MHKQAAIVMTLCACFISLYLLNAGIPGGLPASQAEAADSAAVPRQNRGGMQPAKPSSAAFNSLFVPASTVNATTSPQNQPGASVAPAETTESQLPEHQLVQPQIQPQAVSDNYFVPTGTTTQARPQPLVSPTIEPAAATIPAVAAPNTAAPIRPQPAVSRPQPAAAK